MCQRCSILRISVEKLLERGFEPKRTVVLAFGIDEERSGVDVGVPICDKGGSADVNQGATAIRDYLVKAYGEDAFSILVDEGG